MAISHIYYIILKIKIEIIEVNTFFFFSKWEFNEHNVYKVLLTVIQNEANKDISTLGANN